jgi:ankyrin repeat protein
MSAMSAGSAFESAVDAIITGDLDTLRRLLAEQPTLTRARSTREHHATLLHYVSANGVEGYRQKSPQNIPEITRTLLAAGAEVDAEANMYGSGCTTLGLVATSEPPARAGVQLAVIDVLLEHGASLDRPGLAGRNHKLVYACLANGQPDAADYLARRGAPLDLSSAAGLGRMDDLTRFLDATTPTDAQLADAFAYACGYGRLEAVDCLLNRGIDVDTGLTLQGLGHTGLHVAAYYAHPDVVDTLLRHGARVDAIDDTWHTTPLTWARTGWQERHNASTLADRYQAVVDRLIAAGAVDAPPDHGRS